MGFFLEAGLLDDVVSVYDQTKTTIQGRVSQKLFGSNYALGPALTKFTDVQTETGLTIQGTTVFSSNNRIFNITAEASGLASLILHTINPLTNISTYVGRIQFTIPDNPAATNTYRSIRVIDTGTTGWKIFLVSTSSVLGGIYSGVYLLNNIDLADFVQVGFPTISYATGTNQKAVYHLQDPAAIGVGNLNTAPVGGILDSANNRLYVHNGVAATHQYFVYATNTAPTYSTNAVTGLAAIDIITDTGHTFVDNDPIVFTAITGGAGITVGTTYFVRSSIAGVSYQISATSGGAALNFTTDISAGTVGRAHGGTGSNFVHKTGNLTALTGTLLLIDSEDYASPIDAPVNGGILNGNPCAFFGTSTNLYLGLLSELTSGATSWPSLTTSNILGAVGQSTAPTALQTTWSDVLDCAVYLTNTSVFVAKKVINNQILFSLGSINNTYFEGAELKAVELGFVTVTGMDIQNGILIATSTTVGQRGFTAIDLRSDVEQDYSYIVTKVLKTTSSIMEGFRTVEEAWQYTGNISVFYRTSGFGSISGGWLPIDGYTDLSGIAIGSEIQFKLAFEMQTGGFSSPAQMTEFIMDFTSLNENSIKWEYSDDDSEPSTNRITWRLKETYSSSVPNLRVTVRDLSDTIVANHTTAANAAFFEYSTDGGVNWLTLGTIPNTVGTLVRYTNGSLPAAELRPAMQEAA